MCAQENGFVANGDYDLFDGITTDKQLDDAIVLAKVLLEKAADMAGKQYVQIYRRTGRNNRSRSG